MLIYILKVTTCLAIFYVFYKLLLEQESMHSFKRFYLLAAVVSAFIIPALIFTEYVYVSPEPAFEVLPFDYPVEEFHAIATPEQTDYLNTILWSIYGLGVLVFGFKFCQNLIIIGNRIKTNQKVKEEQIINVLLQEKLAPHTFFNFIFLNKQKFNANEIPAAVLLHEKTHATQKHSADVLLMELVQVFFWFNPFVYLFKNVIKLNHEFLADQAVMQKGVEISTYQKILLAFSSNASSPETALTNAINYSSIKKRFTVMKKNTSKKAVWLRSLLVLPLFALVLYGFSTKAYVEKEIADFSEIEFIKANGQSNAATDAMMLEYNEWTLKFMNTDLYKYISKYDRMVAIYSLMSDHQRNSVMQYRVLPSSQISNLTLTPPTNQQFEALKNSKEYIIWINEKHVENSELDKYNFTDFVHYTGPKWYKNESTEKFPQPRQYTLYTKDGFKKTYIESQINKYKQAATLYSEAIRTYLKGKQTDNSELKILAFQANKIYNTLSTAEINSYNLKAIPPVPMQKEIITVSEDLEIQINKDRKINININASGKLLVQNELVAIEELNIYLSKINTDLNKEERSQLVRAQIHVKNETPKQVIKEVNTLLEAYGCATINIVGPSEFQDGATKEQISEYNAIASKYSDMNTAKQIKKSEIDRMNYLYNLMTDKQKKSVANYPKLPPMPPLPPNTPELKKEMAFQEKQLIEQEKSLKLQEKQLQEQEKELKKQESQLTPKEGKNGFIKINDETFFYNINNGKTEYYNRYGQIVDDKGKVIDSPTVKKGEVSNIPPPPPPPFASNLDHVIEMAKKEATFYYEDEIITADKAIKLLKENKNLNIDSRGFNSNKPVVRISKKPIKTEK